MIRTLSSPSGFDQTQDTSPPGRPSPLTTAPAIAITLRAIAALREGLASARQYEQLRSNGVPHDRAVREALGVGPIPPQAPRRSAKALYFAGKA
jgi:hypothetical protein